MKRCLLSVLLMLLPMACSPVERKAVEDVERTQELILPEYLKHVERSTRANPTAEDVANGMLTPEQAEDRRKLVESLRRLTQTLKETAR